MDLVTFVVFFLSSQTIFAYNPFKASTVSMKEQMALTVPENTSSFELTALLESPPRNSEVFTQAMISLQNLQGESFCHRIAVQLLMNNCKDVKEISNQGLPFKHDAHKNQIEGFITGLTLCVLARGEFVISESCSPFSASALLRAHQQGKRHLEFSKEQNDACVAALSKDASQWATWLSQQREALTICRAVRFDIEKDETIFLHRELTRIMAEFAQGLELDLQRVKQSMVEQTRAMDSQIESVLASIKGKLQGTIAVALNGFQNVAHSLTSTLGNIKDLEQMIKVLLTTIVQSNAEVAAGQEASLVATADLADSRMNEINMLAENTATTLNGLKGAVNQLIPAIIALSERQDATDRKAKFLYAALINMTSLVINQTDSIEQASFAANNLSLQMREAAAAAAKSSNDMSIGNSVGIWFARAFLPPIGVVVGGWGLPGSLVRNGVLYISVMAAIEVPIHLKHWTSRSSWALSDWISESQTQSSPTQLAREEVESLVTTPVELELPEEV